MSDMTTFSGFPVQGQQFLRDLAQNNDREWFEANKSVYQDQLLVPATEFVVAVGTRLQALDPGIQFDTRTNGQGTLMRIYRDVRFSKDKSPYKTAVAGVFTRGDGKKMTGPGYGFHLTADMLELMAGMFGFSKPQLAAYREAVADEVAGLELVAALAAVQQAGAYSVAGEQSKRVPQGYDPEHPRADLLRYKGLYVHPDGGMADPWGMPDVVETAYGHFAAMTPVYYWLQQHVGSAG